MAIHDFVTAVLQAGCSLAVFTDHAGTDGISPTFAGNDQIALEAMVRHYKPTVMVHIHAPGAEHYQMRLRLIAKDAGLESFAIVTVVVDDSDVVKLNALQECLANHDLRVGLVFLDPTLSQQQSALWGGGLKGLLDDKGIIFAHYPMTPDRDVFALRFARENRLDITLGSDFWFCAAGRYVKPMFTCQLLGNLETIEFGSLFEDLTPVYDRNAFLALTQAGIPCLFPVNGGEVYKNVQPRMVPLDEAGTEQIIPYFPAFEAECVSDGGALMFAKNLRMHGLHGHLYSAQRRLYEETIAAALPHRYLDRLKEGIPGYEPTVYRDTVSIRGEPKEILTSFFTRPVTIEENVVVVNMPHIECYNHWIYYLLPRFWYLDQFPELASLPIVMNPVQIRYVEQYLQLLGIDQKYRFIFYDKSVSYNLKRAYIPTIADLPFRAPANIRWLREKFLPHADAVPEGYDAGLYYTTRDSNSHGIINDREIIEFLTPYGFKCLDWGKFTVKQQIALARNAKIVIGEHGSNHTNLVFSSPGLRHLYVQDSNPVLGTDWNTFVAADNGGSVYCVTATAVEYPQTSLARVKVDMDLFKATFHKMMDELGS